MKLLHYYVQMDHYIIKQQGRVCHVDSTDKLICDNNYDYTNDIGTKFSIHSNGNKDSKFCIQSKKNNQYINTTSAGVVKFDKPSCEPTSQFQMSFLDVFDVTQFTLAKDGKVCTGGKDVPVQCVGNVSDPNTTFTLLQESNQYCPVDSATATSIGSSLGSSLESMRSYWSRSSNTNVNDPNAESDSWYRTAMSYIDQEEPEDPPQSTNPLEEDESTWTSVASSFGFTSNNTQPVSEGDFWSEIHTL